MYVLCCSGLDMRLISCLVQSREHTCVSWFTVLCCSSGNFLNSDERNAEEKTFDSSSDLRAVTLTKVTGMHFGIIFPILMELTLIITCLFMLTQQYLNSHWSWWCCYGWPCCHTLQWCWTEMGACELESECPVVTMKEFWEISRSLLSIMMNMSLIGN
jgi:hypothetical protein